MADKYTEKYSEKTEAAVQRVNPTGRVHPLEGEPLGSVPMSITMGKPRAYTSGTPRSTKKQEQT